MRLLGTLLFVLLLAAGCGAPAPAPNERSTSSGDQPAKETSTRHQNTVETTGDSSAKVRRDEEKLASLQQKLEAVAARTGSEIGIAVLGLEGDLEGKEAGVNEDLVFDSASLIKVLVLAELLRQVDEGSVSLEGPLGGATVRQLAESMITTSDNDATNLLIDRVGFGDVNGLASDLGLRNTSLGRYMLDFKARARGEDNYTSASDMVELLAAFWGEDLLSASSREFALSVLEHQSRNHKIPAGLPPGTRVAHKTGELENNEHDAGIVILPDRTFAIAVLTRGQNASGIAAIRESTRLAYGTFSKPE